MMVEIYKDKSYSVEERAKNLLFLMTLEEKVAQMRVRQDFEEIEKDLAQGKMDFGGVYCVTTISQADQMRYMKKFQKYALEKTRLGIPLIFSSEGIHGFLQRTTVFPQCIGIASSFNTKLVEKMAGIIGEEASSYGVRQLLAPSLDLAREIRWGRMQETYGEDPYLATQMGCAYVRSLQSKGVAATLKHYVAHGAPENGINLSSVHYGEREIRELSLCEFEACIKAGAMAIMPAYHELDGIPMHANKKWMVDVLRDELNFDGVTISDWGGLPLLQEFCASAKDVAEVGKQALNAQVDITSPNEYGYGKALIEAVQRGEIDEKDIDRAVYRILKMKFKLGLFDMDWNCTSKKFRSKRSVNLARKVAQQSIVMLKNNGVLPLQANGKKVALFGPGATRVQLGDYCHYPEDRSVLKTVKEGLSEILGDNLLFSQGCNITKGTQEQLNEALKVAEQADVLIVACSDNSDHFGGVGWAEDTEIKEAVTCYEGFDVHDLRLPKCQRDLFNALADTGKEIILLLSTGRPNVIADEYARASAVLQTWYLGEQCGYAVADILFGKAIPTGKLAVSFPRSNGHLPCYYNYRKTCRGRLYQDYGSSEQPGHSYVFSSPDAFLPFGFGLSYVPIEYLSVKAKQTGENEAEVVVEIKNAGNRDTEESILLFLEKIYCKMVVPYVKELKAFTRVKIKAGQTKRVKLKLDEEAFQYIDENMKKAIQKGLYKIHVQDKIVDLIMK